MKLKVSLVEVAEFKKALGILLNLRKQCVFRFLKDQLCIISAVTGEPQAWCKLSSSVFESYFVDSVRNVIALEINIDPLYQVLKHFERSNVNSSLVMRLQKNPRPNGEAASAQSKTLASLSLFYLEQININSTVSHSFNIPVRLLKIQSDERIREPTISGIDMCMVLPNKILPLFKRIERYKTSDSVTISTNSQGYMKFIIVEEHRKVSIQWKEILEVKNNEAFNDEEDGSGVGTDDTKIVDLKVKMKHWAVVSKICESCERIVFIISGDSGVIHSYLDIDQKCEMIYYVNGFSTIDDEEL